MPPTSKTLEGHIDFGSFVRPSVCLLRLAYGKERSEIESGNFIQCIWNKDAKLSGP